MKKILFLTILAFGFIFNACDPMQHINDELDKALESENDDALYLKDRQVAPDAYTLTDEDYELSSNEDVANYKNFSKYAPSVDYLPEILNLKFSAEDAQSMLVTYNYYSSPEVDEENAHEVTEDEYNEMGATDGYFSDEDEAEALIGKLLDRKVYAAEAGTEMTVMYVLYTKSVDRFIQVNDDGTSEAVDYSPDAVVVDSTIYEATGNGTYYNFYTIDDALEGLATYAVDNGTAPVTYEALVYKNYIDTYVVFMYDGMNWLAKQSVMPFTEALNYALDETDITKSTWWADPAIKITLGADDYGLFSATSKYNNFDLRSGETPGTDTELLVDMIGEMLDTNHDAVEDQQYLVTYDYYDGSSGSEAIRIIKAGGDWIEYVKTEE